MVLTTGSAFYIVPQYRFIGTAHSGEMKVAFSLDLDLCLFLCFFLSLFLTIIIGNSSSVHCSQRFQYSPIPTRISMSDFISFRLS